MGWYEGSFKQQCDKAGLDENGYVSALRYRGEYGLNDEAAIIHAGGDPKLNAESFRQKCVDHGLKMKWQYENVIEYRKNHENIPDEFLFDEYFEDEKRFKERFKKYEKYYTDKGVNYECVMMIRRKKPEMSDEEIIEFLKSGKRPIVDI